MRLYFNNEFYNFQKCSLFFIVITNLILLLTNTFIPQPRDPGKRNEYDIYRDTMGNARNITYIFYTQLLLKL